MLNKANTFDETRVVITNSLRLHTNHVICPSCFDINLDCIFRVNYRNLIRLSWFIKGKIMMNWYALKRKTTYKISLQIFRDDMSLTFHYLSTNIINLYFRKRSKTNKKNPYPLWKRYSSLMFLSLKLSSFISNSKLVF